MLPITRFICLLSFLFWLDICVATPYQPTDDEVLLRLPTTLLPLISKVINPSQRLAQAQDYFAQGRRYSDPRLIGTAQRLLHSWKDAENIPITVLLLRAKIAQYRHQFTAARDDLANILDRDSKQSEAWLTLAFIERVQGHYNQAQLACDAVKKQQPIAATLCQASILALRGQLKLAYQTLANLSHLDANTQQWQQTEMAIIQSRLDHPRQAQRHFQRALFISQRDPYLLGAYADFLLANQQAGVAFQLLQEQTQDDSLLLRALLAAQIINAPETKQWTKILRARFDTAILRQETVHQREAARFALFVEQQPQRALALAKANWQLQKEPEDALLFLQAAQRAGQVNAAQSAYDWAQQYAWIDVLKSIAP